MTDFEKLNFKITWIKAGALLASACIISFTIGIYMTDWNQWRRETTKDVGELKNWKETTQASLNNQRANYNRSIKVNN